MHPDDSWSVAEPDSLGLDDTQLQSLAGWLDRLPGCNVHAVVVARNGALAFECYRNGDDEKWRKPIKAATHGPGTKHDLRSATKSILGLLVGIAVGEGAVSSLDEPIFAYFSEYSALRTPAKDRILLRHLLTMSAGFAWDENLPADNPDNGEMRMWRSSDYLRTALEPDVVDEPGANWNYNGGCSELLGAMLVRASGVPMEDYARDKLFEPLGIGDVEWLRHANGGASVSGGLRMRARDLAKVGQLVAARGRWQGRQVVPAWWIDESLTPQIGASDRLFFYGYHWWLGRSLLERREVAWAAGIGLGGQRLFVVPSLGLSVAIAAGHYGDAMQTWVPLVILNRFVLPAVAKAD